MLKIGIITIFEFKNYGNRLQAYALTEVLKKLNCSPIEVCFCGNQKINYLVESLRAKRSLFMPSFFAFKLLSEKNLKSAVRQCKRLKLFLDFGRKMKKKVIVADSDDFDCYVCGSDQIWNPDFAGQSHYFADFASEEKRIAYAASFGVSSLPENCVERYKKLLSGMRCISVRESDGAQLVKQLTGKDVPVVIDPTLMLDRSEWQAMSRKPETDIKGDYILVYLLGDISSETKGFIDQFSRKNNLQVIFLDELIGDGYWNSTGPAEFIWLIENASLVCTDSFHASVFSIIMQTPFIAFHRSDNHKDMHSRLENLLAKFNLSDRFFENIQEDEILKSDYSDVPGILNSEREKALGFLKDALNFGKQEE